jgi:hypothetical protein
MTAERMDELWSEVERALDARRSPFEDATLAARLAGEPGAEQAVRRLLLRLERVAHAAPCARRLRRWPLALAGAAGVLLVALASRTGSDAYSGPRPAPAIHLAVRNERPIPRLARLTLEPARVLAWTPEGLER